MREWFLKSNAKTAFFKAILQFCTDNQFEFELVTLIECTDPQAKDFAKPLQNHLSK